MIDDIKGKVERFKYLRSVLHNHGRLEKIDAHDKVWKASGVLWDKRISIRLQVKYYKTVVRPTMVYESVSSERKKNEAEDEYCRDEKAKVDEQSNERTKKKFIRGNNIRIGLILNKMSKIIGWEDKGMFKEKLR